MATTETEEHDVERYKQAANDVLQQLDFCIGFFSASNKGKIAEQLAHNRAYIREKMMGEAPQPLPTSND